MIWKDNQGKVGFDFSAEFTECSHWEHAIYLGLEAYDAQKGKVKVTNGRHIFRFDLSSEEDNKRSFFQQFVVEFHKKIILEVTTVNGHGTHTLRFTIGVVDEEIIVSRTV